MYATAKVTLFDETSEKIIWRIIIRKCTLSLFGIYCRSTLITIYYKYKLRKNHDSQNNLLPSKIVKRVVKKNLESLYNC